MTETLIEVRELRKRFGDTRALDGVSFVVAKGTVLGLLGPNGAGKTTTIRCLTTLLRPESGTAVVAGHDVMTDAAGVRGSIAVTGQFTALDDLLSGRENLILFARLRGMTKAAAATRADELLAQFDLVESAGKLVRTYSAGMQRRLDLAASLVVEQPVLFLDEPTTGLDPRSRQVLWGTVRELAARGTTILLTTQYLEEADQLADRIAVIDHGTVIAEGPAAELKNHIGGRVCETTVDDETTRDRGVNALRAAGLTPSVSGSAIVIPAPDAGSIAAVVTALAQAGIEPDDIALRVPSLDDVFFALTGGGGGGGGALKAVSR